MSKQGPRDPAETAYRIVRTATGRETKRTPKDEAAVRRGKARANKLTPEERSEIARKAARARWEGQGT